MTIQETIKERLKSASQELGKNVRIIENNDKLDLTTIQNAILLFCPNSTGPGFSNCLIALEFLSAKNYNDQIFVVAIDCTAPEFQIATFGRVLLFWGEIIEYRNGEIHAQYHGQGNVGRFRANFKP
jgi:hypothetical protein